jgi:hypothetical protein
VYEPAASAAGVPASMAVPFGFAMVVSPSGSLPVRFTVAGEAFVDTVKATAEPATKVTDVGLVWLGRGAPDRQDRTSGWH